MVFTFAMNFPPNFSFRLFNELLDANSPATFLMTTPDGVSATSHVNANVNVLYDTPIYNICKRNFNNLIDNAYEKRGSKPLFFYHFFVNFLFIFAHFLLPFLGLFHRCICTHNIAVDKGRNECAFHEQYRCLCFS